MILGVIISLTGVCLLIALMFQMAVFAMPLFAGASAGRLAYETGAGWLGAILVGLLGALVTLGVGQAVLALTKSTTLRLVVMLVFTAPAAFAGYHLVLGLTRIGGAHGAWQIVFAVVGALAIAGAALVRLSTPLNSIEQPHQA